ncbi:MAG TPA: DUF1302 family protein [Burkholderiaceae bacterium]|nr:DUF1302 family protein [Burkholderiaceae bacterium]
MKSQYRLWALTAVAAACLDAHAFEFQTDDGLKGRFDGVVTFGSQIRSKDPQPDAYSSVVSPFVPGVVRGNLAGQNGGSDLNFYKGDQISTVLKGVFDLDVKKGNLGLFVRASAWKDFALGEHSVAYGNYPNGFTPNTPLGDRGFDSSSKFSNAEFRDYFVYGSTTLDDGKTLNLRLGRQVLNWGGSQLIGGGLGATINPIDFSSLFRPGAQPFEGRLPLGMLNARLASGNAWSLEGFLAYEHRGNVYPGCGTFFDIASFVASGCNMISFAGASEQARLATDAYYHRTPDIRPSGGKHFGLSYGFKPAALDADIKLYALNTTSVIPAYRITVNSTAAGSPLNGNYGLIYPGNVGVFGASFNKKINEGLNTYGELAYRARQPITYNATDLLGGFFGRSPSSLMNLRYGILNIPAGGTFDAYDRFGVVTGSLGATSVFPKALGADRVMLTGEVGFSHINGLPSPDMVRFGRGTAYGGAAYVGANGALTACADAVAGKTCTTDGYTTRNAWGLRLLAAATYPNALAGATLTPSILIAKDIKGYSYDGTFSEGRYTVRLGLRAEWAKKYYADLQINRFGGGQYNLLADRSYVSLVGGMRF